MFIAPLPPSIKINTFTFDLIPLPIYSQTKSDKNNNNSNNNGGNDPPKNSNTGLVSGLGLRCSACKSGWGKCRCSNSKSRPIKAKGSWEHARRSLNHNIRVDPRYETVSYPSSQPSSQPSARPSSQLSTSPRFAQASQLSIADQGNSDSPADISENETKNSEN